ncbi:hypothetical protein GCM10010329_00250 [Streptomyces spiroverticillatus]|uniref:Uncharacterized protein n=1 Tax=Streptomyces finlayi TaxID=67296 RepID=A0A918WRW7_9ACTN|nr:hypothetical protein [Streptomyces finlayi]GGZ84807.1 hypothetical protein GCM10010329_00250 [Streptomyces spiroverticillatus]GHC76549.1 hypothetical protein GCM10010334_00250 [Streptomyces finlayi]
MNGTGARTDAGPTSPVRLAPWFLYARSRCLPTTLAVLFATAALAAWSSARLEGLPEFDHRARVVVTFLAPLLAAAAVGTGLLTRSDTLDRTAVRPWWRRRLLHLALLTALAVALLGLAVPGHPEAFGAPAMMRNTLGTVGQAAAGAAVLGARLSWLPMTAYGSAAYLAAPRTPGGPAAVWAYLMQPGPQVAAWVTAGTVYVLGGGLYVWQGARTEA